MTRTLGYIESDIIQLFADIKLGKYRLSHKKKMEQARLAHEAYMRALGMKFKEKELESKMVISKRRDLLFRDLALYVGLSLGTIVILISLGVGFIKKKGGIGG